MSRPHSDDLRLAALTNFSTSSWVGGDPLSDDGGGTAEVG